MDKTLNRLKESQFFLQKLKENKIKQPDFNYYLKEEGKRGQVLFIAETTL